MKTKEQIEQLAERYADGYSTEEAHASYIAFQDGYTQCQQDMQKDVEYWEGEFEHWFKQAMDMSNKYNELLNKQD